MVAELTTKPQNHLTNATHTENRVLHVLIRRHGTSQTFGENLIFMLNRAGMQIIFFGMLYAHFNGLYQDEPLRTSSCSYLS
jgi:hypothetical protein